MNDKDLYGGLIRLHVLNHASQGAVFGLSIIEELREHGYRLSPGTVYPLLHAMETKGYLSVTVARQGRQVRRLYRATPLGRTALREAKKKVRELFGDLFEEIVKPGSYQPAHRKARS